MIGFSGLSFTPAGEERARLAEQRGEKALGKLPIRELSTDDGKTVKVYLVGPVREGGPDERLAWYELSVGF